MQNNNPSLDPANNDTLAGAVTFAFSKMMQNVNGMLPAKVINYDRPNNRAQVQLLIDIVGTDGTQYTRPQLSSIPVFVIGGGGFRLSFPLNSGDLGWVVANDRDISNFLSNYSQNAPNTARIKQFSDGVFFPDVMTGLNTINSDDSASMVLQNNLGTVTISINPLGVVTITANKLDINLGSAATLLAINGTVNVSGTVNQGVPYVP